MDPAGLIPAPDFLIVPWGWFYALLVFTFVLHILFMNVVLGGGIIALFGARKTKGEDPTAKTLAAHMPVALALTVNLAVPPVLFLQVLYGNFMYSSSQLMAVWWLSIVAIVIAAYYLLYIHKFKFEKLGGSRSLVIGAAVALLLLTGFILTNNMTFMLRPETWFAYFDNRTGTMLNFGEPQLIPRYLHFVAASIAVGGLYTAIVWKIREKRGVENAAEHVRTGMRWFSQATMAQLLIGPLFLITLKRDVMFLFLGDNMLYTGVFLASMALVALVLMLAQAGKVYATAAVTLLLVTAMAFVRDFVRMAYLEPYHDLSAMPVNYQYSPMIVFFVVFAIGLALIYYMLKLAFRGKEA
jgi:hypothetical protein